MSLSLENIGQLLVTRGRSSHRTSAREPVVDRKQAIQSISVLLAQVWVYVSEEGGRGKGDTRLL